VSTDTLELPALYAPPWPAPPRRTRLHPGEILGRLAALAAGLVASAVVAALLVQSLMAGPPTAGAAAGRPRLYDWHGDMPRGVTLSGLQAYLFTAANVTMMTRQMRAARYTFHANTVRLQILQDKLAGAGGHRYSAAYMADIRAVVSQGLALGLTVVLNAQTEQSTGYPLSEPLPDHATHVFWRDMMHYYKNNPRIVFDLFNEPRRCTWGQWRAATQPLINEIRDAGARNQIYVDGINWGSTLAGVPVLSDPLHDIVYTFHHPAETRGGTNPRPSWAAMDAAFGDLAARGYPVVDGEFANYQGSYAWTHARHAVPAYFRYLAAHHIGLLAWSEIPGSLNAGLHYDSVSRFPQGDGQAVRRYFGRQAR
jgi:hypothetical protein